MRTLVDIPEDELEELNLLSRSRKVSRAELIRQAVAGFLAGEPGWARGLVWDMEEARGGWGEVSGGAAG
ncbi:MAG: CopG family transcriptional regulator [Edaphobacter sp.]